MKEIEKGIAPLPETPTQKTAKVKPSIEPDSGKGKPNAHRRDAGPELELSEVYFRSLIEHACDIISTYDGNGIRLYTSPSIEQVLGYKPAELIGKSGFDLLHPDDRAAVAHLFPLLLQAPGTVITKEVRYQHKDGTWRVLEVTASNLLDNPAVASIVVNSRDITERRRAEAGRDEAERKYRDIFENVGEGIFQTTPDGKFITANPALARMLGFDSPEELVSVRTDIARELYVDPRQREEFKRLLDRQGFVKDFEFEAYRKDGSTIWLSENVRAVCDQTGVATYFEGISRDITERKLAQEKSAAFATLARKLSGTVTQVDAGSIIARTAKDLFGWDACNLDLYDADRDVVLPLLNIDTIDGQEVKVTPLISAAPPTARGRRVIERGPELILRQEPIRFDADSIPFGDTSRHPASLMTVPIQQGSKVSGLLSIQSYTPGAYDEIALKDFVSLADHCAEAINRIHVEELLRDSEKRFRQLAEHLEDVVWIADRDLTRVLYINPSYERVFGRSCRSVYDRLTSFVDAVHPDDREIVNQMLERQRQGDYRPLEYRIIRSDGSVRWLLRRAFPIKNREGDVYRIAGIAQDITERKRAEEALRESEARNRAILESALDCIVTIDHAGLVVDWNPAAERTFGYSRDQAIGREMAELIIPPSFREQHHRGLVRYLETGEGPVLGKRLELSALRADGSEFPCELAITAIESEGSPMFTGYVRDITEHKRAQHELRESEERYRDLVENSRELMCTHDLDGKVLSVNRAAVETFGYEPHEFVGKGNIRDILTPEVRDQFQDYMAKILEHKATSGLMLVQTRSGERRILEYYNSLRTEGVAAPIVRGMARDITEQRRAENALRESEERYRELFENAKDAIYVHDLRGRYVSVNRAAEKLSGYSRDEIIGKHYSNFVVPRDLAQVRTSFARKLDHLPETTYQVDVIRKDRRRVPVEVSSRLIYENGVPVGVQGVARDISERKRAEEARSQLALIVESSDDAIIGKTLDGIILSWNRGAEQMYGYSALEIVGCPITVVVPSDRLGDAASQLAKIRRGESIKHFESLGRRKDGKLINVSLSVSPVKNAQGRIIGAATIARDITQRKQAEQVLKTFSRRLVEAQEAERKKIARELHDEIGQILTAIRISLQSIQRGLEPTTSASQIEESISVVDEALNRVRELSLELRPALLDDLGLAAALRWYLQRYSERTGIQGEVTSNFNEDFRLPRKLETACFRIVQEALTNVARHAEASNVTIALNRLRRGLQLKVVDDGKGFDSVSLFANASSQSLGLHGIQERAFAVGGNVEIQTAPGQGTCLSATFPLKQKSGARASAA